MHVAVCYKSRILTSYKLKMVVKHSIQYILDELPNDFVTTLPVTKQNTLKLEFRKDDCIETVYGGQQPLLPFANSEVFHAPISHWRRLTAVDEGCKAVYEVTFDVANSHFRHKAGDTIGIIPHNNASEVNLIIKHLDLTALADVPYTLSADANQKGCKVPPHIPVKSTIRHVLTYLVDLRSVLKKLFLLALSKHTKVENERKILEYLSSKEGSTAYTTHILNKNMCILDIFAIFQSCKPPIETLFAHLPRLLPRPYSVVNSGMKDPSRIKICFSVMLLSNNRKGLTTSWLENIILNQEFDIERRLKNLSITNKCDGVIPIYIRKNLSRFCLPQNVENPLIFIGPGTGVSSFLGFLEEIQLAKENNPNKKFGETCLFFGCRDPKLDFIYKEELNEFLSRDVLGNLFTAFSRIEHAEVKYIQDTLIREGDTVAKLIRNGASIFVCGDLKNMAAKVKDALVKCLVNHDNQIQEDAERYINDMQKGNRYLVDAWS